MNPFDIFQSFFGGGREFHLDTERLRLIVDPQRGKIKHGEGQLLFRSLKSHYLQCELLGDWEVPLV